MRDWSFDGLSWVHVEANLEAKLAPKPADISAVSCLFVAFGGRVVLPLLFVAEVVRISSEMRSST